MTIRVTVWNEFEHEKANPVVQKIYPDGIHQTIAEALTRQGGFSVRTATLQEPDHGLTEAALDETDVLFWWGHRAHSRVEDAIVDRVQQRVLAGMGLIVLHSGHYSKIFKRMMGTNCSLRWRVIRDESGQGVGEKERLWNLEPGHPIAEGLGDYFELPHTEMYGERFDIPTPEELIFVSWFAGGEVFRSGCCWRRGHGRIFYFRPGHETFPIYHDAQVQKVLGNAARWAAPRIVQSTSDSPRSEPIEDLS